MGVCITAPGEESLFHLKKRNRGEKKKPRPVVAGDGEAVENIGANPIEGMRRKVFGGFSFSGPKK